MFLPIIATDSSPWLTDVVCAVAAHLWCLVFEMIAFLLTEVVERSTRSTVSKILVASGAEITFFLRVSYER